MIVVVIVVANIITQNYTVDSVETLSDELGKVRRGTEAIEALNQFRIVGTLKSGRNTVGYMVQNAGCGTKRLSRADVIKLAKQGRIGNARVQQYQGRDLLRGVDCNLDQLPSEIMK